MNKKKKPIRQDDDNTIVQILCNYRLTISNSNDNAMCFTEKKVFAKKIKNMKKISFCLFYSELRLHVLNIKTNTIKNDLSLSSSKKIENISIFNFFLELGSHTSRHCQLHPWHHSACVGRSSRQLRNHKNFTRSRCCFTRSARC